MAKTSETKSRDTLVAENRKARFEYEILETFEAGLALVGTEVKTLRGGKVTLEGSFARVQGSELFLMDAHIQEYEFGNRENHVPTRKRKLLLHKREIRRMKTALEQKGHTLIPLRIYFSERGWAKITIAVARGKKLYDKRESLKKKAARREMRE